MKTGNCEKFLSVDFLSGRLPLLCAAWIACFIYSSVARADERLEFFEKRIRPVLIEHCYRCHSADAEELRGGLRLDSKSGWQQGGDSGQPAIEPGSIAASLLIRSIEHAEGIAPMPPMQAKLADSVIADLKKWVETGAFDPRDQEMPTRASQADWQSAYTQRLNWWSLQPIKPITVPEVSKQTGLSSNTSWPRNEVDNFVLAGLKARGLQPNVEASKATLARRLSLALTGLPLDSERLNEYLRDDSPQAYDRLVTWLLDSPHFGERWARHWMDVVHYSDTHGYEWDVPVKNAWRYRDYLIRAFNSDISYRQLVLEQLAGDLLPPRINAASGINESLIGPLMLRLGERRHGDNSAAEGISQEAVANMIDTIGKAFLGTTLACAQCHNHKLDAVEQRDYYSLSGMLMSTRFVSRPIDADAHRNDETIEKLRGLKQELRRELAKRWLEVTQLSNDGELVKQLRGVKADEKPSAAFPTTLLDFWKRSLTSAVTESEFTQEREKRESANETNLRLLADFAPAASNSTSPTGSSDWRWEGAGMQSGQVADGELIVTDEGDQALVYLLPAGRYSHVWSARLAGSLHGPQMDPTEPITFSIEGVAGKFASQSFIVDRALNPERLAFPKRPFPVWQKLTAGNFDSLEGTIDRSPRRVYFELATKSLNNYFPPRVGYGGASEAEVADPRSWFGVSRIVAHAADKPPQDDLERFVPLFGELAEEKDWSLRLVTLLRAAIERWSAGECRAPDVQLLNDAIQNKLLPIGMPKDSAIERLVLRYREQEKLIQPDQTVGSVAEWNEAQDDRMAIRGVYTDLGEQVPRGFVRFLPKHKIAQDSSSGRLQWAETLADENNPLTARVYVNRIWHYLFGAGLVRTTDDFGHLGELPVHQELLDYLSARFMNEGWSTKRLIRLLVSSATWRQSSLTDAQAAEIDPENRYWHHMPMRRLEAEALRDSMLAVSGCLDGQLYGPPIEPYRTAEDAQKRLFKGPLDGERRRSIYLEMTLMEPPRFLAIFNQPLPKQTMGRRDVTNVPDQALALLNDPFSIEMARQWSQRLMRDQSTCIAERNANMIQAALSRPIKPQEADAMSALVHRLAEQRQLQNDLLNEPLIWQDVAHAVFNLKEFLYVP